jgi:hypothetical protein
MLCFYASPYRQIKTLFRLVCHLLYVKYHWTFPLVSAVEAGASPFVSAVEDSFLGLKVLATPLAKSEGP